MRFIPLSCSHRATLGLGYTPEKIGKIFGTLMLIRCLWCETRETFVPKVIRNLTKMRFLQLMRLD